MPLADRWSAQAAAFTTRFTPGWSALSSFGIVATLCEATLRQLPEPFLCFKRRAKGDVMLNAHKIAGSAQRRKQGALVQHGSMILLRSSAAPEIAGIEEIGGEPFDPGDLIERWLLEMSQDLPDVPTKSGWLASETRHAQSIQAARFDNPSWLGRRATT